MSNLMDYTKLESVVKKHLKPSRFEHSKGVAKVCSELSTRFLLDKEAGLYTGIFHDYARYYSDSEILKACRKGGVDISKEEEEKPPIDPMALVGKSLFKVSQLRKKEETVQKQTESEPVSENDVTFEDLPKNTARIPDELLDDVFTNVRIEDVGVKYSDDEDDADVPQAKGTSFEDIDTAVKTVKASKATDKEKRHAGKVFHEMDGNQFYEKFMEQEKHS